MSDQKSRARYGVTPEQFVVAWQKSASAQEAADLMGMPKSAVLARASTYRRKGVKLKNMPRPDRKIDVGGLNNLAS